MTQAKHLKIIVAGRINSGKSMFIRSISEIDVVSLVNQSYASFLRQREIEARNFNLRENVINRYGRVTVDDELTLHLYSVASHLPDISSIPEGRRGFVVLVDSTDERSFYEGRALLLYMFHFPRVPYIVVANKQDLEGALTVEQIRHKMRLPETVPMIGCISKERDSVRNVLLELLYLILPD